MVCEYADETGTGNVAVVPCWRQRRRSDVCADETVTGNVAVGTPVLVKLSLTTSP